MSRLLKQINNFILIGFLLTVFACQKAIVVEESEVDTKSKVEILFEMIYQGKEVLPNQPVVVSNGDTLFFQKNKMLLSGISLVDRNQGEIEPLIHNGNDNLFLIDIFKKVNVNNSGISSLNFEMPIGKYYDIRFNIGVPRSLNHQDPTSAVPPLNIAVEDMYWSWNAGYIFWLMEGYGNKVYQQKFHWAIGGDDQNVPVSFAPFNSPNPVVEVKNGFVTQCIIEIDLNKLLTNFDGSKWDYVVENGAQVHGGQYGAKLRQNAMSAFSIKKVSYLEK